VPNVGEQVAQEGTVVGLNWADADLRVLDREPANGH
jgi:hypothetical protein